ncbi:ComEA family DNA-binding protein [Paenibacillus thailandensis]|uniref:ComEA family DNA-binding protein n=1 Tax=Paenibacillus thailandensis TaxID=393250 RepID=A0ABW5QXS1_9BACL
MKTYTDRGKTWELINSWWVLLTLVPFGFVSFISFFYIGTVVKNQRWRIWGIVYLAAVIAVFATAGAGIGAAIAVALWVLSAVHAFKIRPAYLIQLDVYKANESILDKEKIAKLRQEAERKFKSALNEPIQPPKLTKPLEQRSTVPTVDPPVPDSLFAGKRIDVNMTSETELAAIPQIGIILAKKIVLKRQETGGFRSFDEFVTVMGLREQAAVKLREQLAFSQQAPQRQTTSSGRKIDF